MKLNEKVELLHDFLELILNKSSKNAHTKEV